MGRRTRGIGESMTSDITQRPKTVLEALYEIASQHPQDVAIVAPSGRRTYAEVLKGMEQYASSLIKLGIRPADRVVLRMRNEIDAVLLILGCLRIGAIAVPLSTRLNANELRDMLRRLQPSLFAGENDQSSDLSQVGPEILPRNARYWHGRRESD